MARPRLNVGPVTVQDPPQYEIGEPFDIGPNPDMMDFNRQSGTPMWDMAGKQANAKEQLRKRLLEILATLNNSGV